MGLLSSHRVSRVLWYSGYLPVSPLFRLRDCHSLWSIFPNRSTRNDLSFASPYPRYIATSGLGCFPFARHYLGNRFYFLFLRVLRCFSSPGSPTYIMYSCMHTMSSTWWVPSFGNLRIRLFAPPRSLSQLITSFFGAECQGIHLTLFVAWSYLLDVTVYLYTVPCSLPQRKSHYWKIFILTFVLCLFLLLYFALMQLSMSICSPSLARQPTYNNTLLLGCQQFFITFLKIF